ncbi:MAG TPA: hypothetical protein VGM19_00505 [Armatimonadota bacterium]|jgi:hypothetical protein
MQPRRDWIFDQVRRSFRPFVDAQGVWQSPPGVNPEPDWRVIVQVALPFLLGDEADRRLARAFLTHPTVHQRINACSFTTEYVLAVILGAGEALPADLRALLRERIGRDLLHYAKKDLQHHGYNDNHVTLATASLVLGGELTDNPEAVEEGRANLLNFRDTFLRRGFMHETNDCYLPHSMYSTAAVAEFAQDEQIKQLALDCEARLWADWIGHWHPNLSRKPGPSARDYTGGRLNPLVIATGLWGVFGEGFGQPAFPPADVFAAALPEERHFEFNGNPSDGHWNLGFLARMMAHPFHVPEQVAPLIYDRAYPHVICGTHETGHFDEGARHEVPGPGGTKVLEGLTLTDVLPFSGREIFTYQYQEADWAMGTASQRMIGNCPNNNWGVYYRKSAPLTRTADQGLLFCSYTINDKPVTGAWTFQMDPHDPAVHQTEDVEHWFDNGRYAGVQHERTSLLLYRPRVHERHALTALATTLVFPRCFRNRVDHLWLGDTEIEDFTGESAELWDIFIQDGPLYLGIRPLLSRPQACAGARVRAVREEFWGLIHLYSYRGPALSLSEMDLCRIGGGFLCEVATTAEFPSIEAFRAWFRAGQVLDDQLFFMRQVRYHREGLDLGLRWDVWTDTLMYRMLNGREYPLPTFDCTGVNPESLPWLTGDVSGFDHFTWAARQARRPLAPHCQEPGTLVE